MDWAMERGLEISAGLVNYIGNPQRRTELAEDIATALRAAERRALERARDIAKGYGCGECGNHLSRLIALDIQSEIDALANPKVTP